MINPRDQRRRPIPLLQVSTRIRGGVIRGLPDSRFLGAFAQIVVRRVNRKKKYGMRMVRSA